MAYLCKCGWTYCTKYKKERIAEHNKTCPVNSYYGVVPAFEPKDTSKPENMITEFIGYKERLDNNKCIFDIAGRHIAYTDASGDHKGIIIKDMGKGFVLVKDARNIRHVFVLKQLRYHDTVKIWRNY